MAKKAKRACFGEYCFIIEHADTLVRKARGLMFRRTLPKDRGMLFSFSKPRRIAMWMFGMRFPIDIVWLGSDFRVVHIEKEVKPCTRPSCPSFSSPQYAQHVLEINAGLCDAYGLTEGVRMEREARS